MTKAAEFVRRYNRHEPYYNGSGRSLARRIDPRVQWDDADASAEQPEIYAVFSDGSAAGIRYPSWSGTGPIKQYKNNQAWVITRARC
jgi:hypothetical protein